LCLQRLRLYERAEGFQAAENGREGSSAGGGRTDPAGADGTDLSASAGSADGFEMGVSRREGRGRRKRRELDEELGIAADIGNRVAHTRHTYRSGSSIDLQFFAVYQFSGEMTNRIFHDLRWCPLRELTRYDFLAADRILIRELAAGKLL
jgi:hypothetical protein